MTSRHNQALDDLRLVVALRAARAAVGWSQEQVAQRLGLAKTTIARAELMEGRLRADQLAQLLRLYKSVGIDLDFMLGEGVTIKVDEDGLRQALEELMDDARRRADRKKTGVGLIAGAMQQAEKGQSK